MSDSMTWMSDKVDKIAPALLAAQKAIKGAKKDRVNPGLKNKYADLGSVFDACKEELNENGIIIMQPMGTQGEKNTLRTVLLHESGQFFVAEAFLIHIDPNRGINEAQAMGSVISYMRRYQLSAMAGVLQEDDDGNAAGKAEPAVKSEPAITVTVEEILAKIAEAKAMLHLANIWDKYEDDMKKMSPPVQAELAAAKNARKDEIANAAKAALTPDTEAAALEADAARGAGEQSSMLPDEHGGDPA